MARYKLEDIFDLQMGKTPSRNNSEYWNTCDNKWISIGDLTQAGKYITDTKEYLSDVAVEESGIKIIPANTVVMSFKLSIGKTAITSEDMYSNEAIMAFHDKHVVDLMPEYIYYMFKYKDWDEGTNKAVMGKTLNKATLSKVEIEVCPLEKQKKIVELLDKVSTVLDGRNEELKKLDELIKARFVELFGDPFDNEKWDICELKDISESMIDGSNVDPKYYDSEGDVLFLRIQNVWRNEFRLDDSVYISREINNNNYYDTSLKTGDLLITKIGRFYTKDSSLGRVSVYRGKDDCANYSNNIMRVRLIDSMNSEFVNALLNLDDYQKYIKRTSKGGTDKRALSKSLIGSYPIILPPKSLQDEFVSFIKQVDKSKVAVQKALDEAQLLFDSLMQEYFG
ncbi:restriction endonuclease subunit S [Lachnobacterium bovis]|nr:restriction endonuclease subunit S [Lachnobacterium bovis]